MENKMDNKQETIIVKQREMVILPEGEYTAELNRIKQQSHKEYGDSLGFQFKITGPDFVGQFVYGNVNPVLTENSRLLKWIQAFGGTVIKGTDFDLASLVGKHVRIYVGFSKTGKNKVINVAPLNRVVPTVTSNLNATIAPAGWSAPPQVNNMNNSSNVVPQSQVVSQVQNTQQNAFVQPQTSVKVAPSALDF